jgi:hypothetical protein
MNGVQDDVPRKPTGNDTPVAIRVPEAWLKRADELRAFLCPRPGLELTRSDILRMCLAKGLEAIEAERDAAKPPRGKR